MSDKGGINYNHSLKTLGNGGIVYYDRLDDWLFREY